MLNQPVIVERITERDEEALRYLKNIEVQEFEDIKSGYRIIFEFSQNPFFENDKIIKEFILVNESGEPTSTSTPIKWKNSMNLTVSHVPTKGQKRPRDAEKSFFTWFSETQEEGADEIGEAIKDELWTNPLPFFLNDAVMQEDEVDEQYDEEGESGDEGELQEVVVVEDDEEEEEYEEDDGGQSGQDPPAEFEEEGEEADVLGEEEEGEEAVRTASV
jgi:template-activating factor I